MKIIGYSTAATLVASAAFSQQFYVGGAISSTELELYDIGDTDTFSKDFSDISVFAGGRYYPLPSSLSGFFIGGEVQFSRTRNFPTFEASLSDDIFSGDFTTRQAELHLGYTFDRFSIFGFVGRAKNEITTIAPLESEIGVYDIHGFGVEFDISDRFTARLEHELSSFIVDACENYDADIGRTSIGLVYKF